MSVVQIVNRSLSYVWCYFFHVHIIRLVVSCGGVLHFRQRHEIMLEEGYNNKHLIVTHPTVPLSHSSLTAAYSTSTYHLRPHFCALLSRLIHEDKKPGADTP